MLDDLQKFKQDPQIRFEYQYMTDNASAKVIDKVMRQAKENTHPAKGQAVHKKKKRHLFLPILFGMTFAFCIACAVLCWTILKNSSSPLFSNATDIELPDFTGMTEEQVKALDLYSQIKVDWQEEYNSQQTQGLVYQQTPLAGRTVKTGQTVTLKVSLGTKYVEIPDLTNQSQDDATDALKQKELSVLVVKTVDDSVAVGAVIRTDPAAGETVEAGSTVVVYVSRTQVETNTTMPDLTGLSYNDAVTLLASKRLTMGAQTHAYSDSPAGTIIAQGVEPETVVRINSRISVTISDGPEPTPQPSPTPTPTPVPTATAAPTAVPATAVPASPVPPATAATTP